MIIKKKGEQKKETLQQEIASEKPESLDEIVAQEKFDLFDLDNIEFSQRQERRRGDRRRGYRRIDERNLVSRAQEEANSIKENARKEGYQEGLAQAQEDIAQLKDTLNNFLDAKQEVFEYIAPDILEISVDIARKIINKEIEQDPMIVLNLITQVLDGISSEEPKITIVVNPTQEELVREKVPEIEKSLNMQAKTNIITDDTIDIGGCIVQTSNGIVDATINTQLEVLKEAFKGM